MSHLALVSGDRPAPAAQMAHDVRNLLATVGLQALDFSRGGLADADLIVATGVDEREALADWRLAPVVEVAP